MDTRPFAITDPAEPGRRIQGRVHLPEGTEESGAELPYVLMLHGFKGFMDWGFFPELARRLVLQGIAAVPFNFSGSGVAEDPLAITDDEAFAMARKCAPAEGIPVGISSGAALPAALRVGARPENAGKRLVVVLASSAERYLSTPLFDGLGEAD